MATCNLATLTEQACANGFFDLDKAQVRAATLQLLCNIIGGEPDPTPCVNLIPDGAVYNSVGGGHYNLPNLICGATYQITFGVNDANIDNTSGVPVQYVPPPNAGDVKTFVAACVGLCTIIGKGHYIPVTATLCLVSLPA